MRDDGRQMFRAAETWGQWPFAGQPKAVAARTAASPLTVLHPGRPLNPSSSYIS